MVGGGVTTLLVDASSIASMDKGLGLSKFRMACETIARSDCPSFPINTVPVSFPAIVSVFA